MSEISQRNSRSIQAVLHPPPPSEILRDDRSQLPDCRLNPTPFMPPDRGSLLLECIKCMPSEDFVNSRICRDVTIKCCVAVVDKAGFAHSAGVASDTAAAAAAAAAAADDSVPPSSGCAPSASCSPASSTASSVHLHTFPQPLLSHVTWDDLAEDEFTLNPRLHSVLVHITTSTNEILSFNRVSDLTLDGGAVSFESQNCTVVLTFSPVALLEAPSAAAASQSRDSWTSVAALDETERQSRIQSMLEGFERCWGRRKKIMDFERKKQNIKELKAKIARLRVKTAEISAQCNREKLTEEMQQLAIATAQRAQISAEELLKLRLTRITSLRDALACTNKRIEAKRTIMLQELGELFPIGISGKGVTICALPLPVSVPFKEEDPQLIAAACVLAQLMVVVSRYVHLPLVFPVRCQGSFTTIFDGEQELGFYTAGKDRSIARSAVTLLFQDLQLLLRHLGHPDAAGVGAFDWGIFRQLKMVLGSDVSADDASVMAAAAAGMAGLQAAAAFVDTSYGDDSREEDYD